MATPRRGNRSILFGGGSPKHLPLIHENRLSAPSAVPYNAKPEKRQTKVLKIVLPLVALSVLAIWLQKGQEGRLTNNQKFFDITNDAPEATVSYGKLSVDAMPKKNQRNTNDDSQTFKNNLATSEQQHSLHNRVSEGTRKKHLMLSARAREVEDMLWTKTHQGPDGGDETKTNTNLFDYHTGSSSSTNSDGSNNGDGGDLPSATTITADDKKGQVNVRIEDDEDEDDSESTDIDADDDDEDEDEDEHSPPPPPPKCQLRDSVDKNGNKAPMPVILMTLGRSGSSSIWQVMGKLTGLVTPSEELTGSSGKQSKDFFNGIDSNDGGNWAINYMCDKQKEYPNAGMVGFKWKPFGESIFHEASVSALKAFAKSSNPQIKIVRSKRNLLDRAISVYKHRNNDGAPAHCRVGDVECIEKHKNAMKGLEVPVNKLLRQLASEHEEEERVDQLLKDLGVPHVHVSFEKLYYGDNIATEWMKIFDFLGIGPSEGLLSGEVEAAMEHAATSNPFHNQTLANYKEVKKALDGTEFEVLLH